MDFARIRSAVVLVPVLLAVVGGAAIAASDRPGTIDGSFGEGGRAVPALPPTFLHGAFTHIAETPGGKLVASIVQRGDAAINSSSERFTIERRQADGSLDPAFGTGGSLSVPEPITALAVDQIGRILYAAEGQIHRLDPDGTADSEFSSAIPKGPTFMVEQVKVADDGNVIAAGFEYVGGGKFGPPETVVTLLRLTPQGALDASFGSGGTLSFPQRFDSRIGGLVAFADGSILVQAGGLVYRFRPDGTLDPGFGAAGTVDPGPDFDAAAMAVDTAGRIVLAGSTPGSVGSPASDYLFRRYEPAGAPDLSFASGGVAAVDYGKHDRPIELSKTPDGGVVLLGDSFRTPFDEDRPASVVVRLDAQGSPPAGFGTNGVLKVEPPQRGGEGEEPRFSAAALLVTGSGRIVAAGGDSDATLVVRALDGRPDPNFGGGSSAVLRVGTRPSTTVATGLVVEPNGDLLVPVFTDAGRRDFGPALLGFNSAGIPRPGHPSVDLPLTGSEPRFPGQTVADGPAKLVSLSITGRGGYLARHYRGGRPDRSFGGDSRVNLPDYFKAKGLIIGRDHSVNVFGTAEEVGMMVMRFTPRGRHDRSFSSSGTSFVPLAGDSAEAYAALLMPRRGLIIVGSAHARKSKVAIIRLLPNGEPDPGFGRNGIFLSRVGATARQIARQGRHLLVAGVRNRRGAGASAFLLRVDARGRLDRSFGRRGVLECRRMRKPLAIVPSHRGFTLVGVPGNGGVVLRGFRPDGEIDGRFGAHGTTVAGKPKGSARYWPVTAARQPNGRIVVAGTIGTKFSEGDRVELLRFR